MRFVTSALIGAAMLAGSALSAEAAALALNDINLRTGPGTAYPVIAVIPGGSNVDVYDCGAGWCTVAWFGRTGYVNQAYLESGGPRVAAPPPPPPPVYVEPAPVVVAPYYGPYWGPRPYYYRRW
jgi:uncharacterized protein YraI